MSTDKIDRRLKFYGLNDYGTFFEVKRVMDYLDGYNENKTDYTLAEVIELYNVLQFVEHGVFSKDCSDKKCASYKALIPKLKKSVSLFFNAINEPNARSVITEIDYNYRQDLLLLLSKNKVYERVSATMLLSALQSIGIGIGDILENKDITTTYDQDIRSLIIAKPKNAEQLVYKYLEAKDRREVHLPASLTADDAHRLMEEYVDSDGTNPNYVKLIADSRVNKLAGIDAKLKLKARRKHDLWTDEFFKENKGGMTFGCEVRLSEEQEESLVIAQDGMVTKYSYSKKWLEQNSAPAQVVGNFINLFGFVSQGMILTMPSHKAELGVFERFMGVKGKEAYLAGVAFQFREQSALLQTMMYEKFLRSGKNNLENVLTWFFNDYLKNRFGAEGFKYNPSSKSSTYLEKSRHVFTEMESVLKQFTLYVENGEIDKELLAITSDQVRYHDIPSLIADKYAYASDVDDILSVQFYMFSDQSGLTYIDDSLKASNLFELLVTNEVKYDDFHDHQKPKIDKLIALGILEKVAELIKFRSEDQVTVLKNLFGVEALSYYHYPSGMQSEMDDMVSKGWLTKKTSLLTDPEASYFNYFLNQQEFSDGYDLRNKYLHGSQADKDDENAHYTTYIIALKLMMALIIKISSDFLLRDGIKYK